MLIKIIVDNFLSFETETELTMISSNKTRKKTEHKIDVKKVSLLKYAVIYGANAAGKSNLIEAFQFIQYCVTKAIPANAKTKFCKTSEENESRPSLFEIQFTINNKFYAYGFSAILSQRKICEEWLYELHQNGTTKTLFERVQESKPTLGESAKLKGADKAKMETYLSDFDENADSLFLTFMNKGKKHNKTSKLMFFVDVYEWITKGLTVCTPKTALSESFSYYYDNATLSTINDLIQTFDTGITDVRVEKITDEELKQDLPSSLYEDIMTEITERIEDDDSTFLKMTVRSNTSFIRVEWEKGQEPEITTIRMKHGTSFYDYKFKEESEGTRRLFELMDILLNKSENKVYVIDEMERSLHPKLTAKFIELFDKLHAEQKMQLIFTTHEAAIMDQELFRRDEIWFVERDKDNHSAIYSLDTFKERYDKKLSKAYLEGRYGAIPVFSRFGFKEDE